MNSTRNTLFALAAPLALGLAAPGSAAEVQIAAQEPVVELQVTESVKGTPDVVQVGAGVQTRAPTAVEAARLNAAAMDRIIIRLRALGIKREDIQTSNFSLNPQWQYGNDGAAPHFLGYDVTNQVNVKLRRLDKAGETLDALIASGANSVSGPNFMLEDDTSSSLTFA